jgi:nucleotide-sensitive chloride channel 1A
MEVLNTSPEVSSFVPVAEHQSRTPSSFYSGPPVLHYHSQRCKIVVLERELLASPALNALRGENATHNASTEDDEKEVAIDGVDVWVTSE